MVISKDRAEVLKLNKTKQNKKEDFATVYVPPKTNTWTDNNCEVMLMQTMECLRVIIEYGDIIMVVSDFICEEVQ